jgi:hypothetical protein
MGTLIYGDAGIRIDVADTLLAYVQIVTGKKLAVQQGFFLSWKDGLSVGGGRSCVWMSTSVPLVFSYERAAAIRIDPARVRRMLEEADTASGLSLDAHLGIEEPPHSTVRSAPSRRLRVAKTA